MEGNVTDNLTFKEGERHSYIATIKETLAKAGYPHIEKPQDKFERNSNPQVMDRYTLRAMEDFRKDMESHGIFLKDPAGTVSEKSVKVLQLITEYADDVKSAPAFESLHGDNTYAKIRGELPEWNGQVPSVIWKAVDLQISEAVARSANDALKKAAEEAKRAEDQVKKNKVNKNKPVSSVTGGEDVTETLPPAVQNLKAQAVTKA